MTCSGFSPGLSGKSDWILIRLNSKHYNLVLLLVLTTMSGPVLAGAAMDWIGKMSNAMRNLSYQGHFVYIHENQIESMSIYHLRNDSGEHERLLSLNGEAREVIRDNKNLTCIWPSSRKIVVDSSRKNSFSPLFILEDEDVARIEKHYEFELIGKARIANHEAIIVHIKPGDQYRYGLKFWINASNGLLLKSELINESDVVVEQVMFTNIELLSDFERAENIPFPEINDGFSVVQYHSGEHVENQQADMNWSFSNLPNGFKKESAVKRMVGDTGRFIQQIVYSDGLASLSVFIEEQTSESTSGETSMGAVNGFIFLMNDYSVTAIGEVPAVTVRQVAESVSFSSP